MEFAWKFLAPKPPNLGDRDSRKEMHAMSYLYVCEQGSVITINGGRFIVKQKDGLVRSIPSETLETIEVFGNVQLTTPCIRECLTRGINVIFYSTRGAYFGRLISTNHVNTHRQRIQAEMYQDEKFRLDFSKKIIQAKAGNQMVVLRRYARNRDCAETEKIKRMRYLCSKIDNCQSIEQLMGYEGNIARIYFESLGELIEPEFRFDKRTRRPPLDPFNSCISLGYSIIMNEIYGKLEGKGLNPYFGVMHADREKHPTLASDLMEEWRAVLVDTTAMSIINGHEVNKENFYTDMEEPGVFLDGQAFRLYVDKLEKKLRTENRYLSYVDYSVSFRRAIDLQIDKFIRAMEERNVAIYEPIKIR